MFIVALALAAALMPGPAAVTAYAADLPNDTVSFVGVSTPWPARRSTHRPT